MAEWLEQLSVLKGSRVRILIQESKHRNSCFYVFVYHHNSIRVPSTHTIFGPLAPPVMVRSSNLKTVSHEHDKKAKVLSLYLVVSIENTSLTGPYIKMCSYRSSTRGDRVPVSHWLAIIFNILSSSI